jgi:hypothetical protein
VVPEPVRLDYELEIRPEEVNSVARHALLGQRIR